jgi:hypothetical protein
MLLAIVTSHMVVTPPDGGKVVVWAGLPLAIAALGLLLAASIGAEALSRMVAGRKGLRASLGTGTGMAATLIVLVGLSAPALAAAAWLSTGVSGPVHPVTSQVVPELVAVADGQSRQVRTLVLRSDHGRISYLLLRGASPSLADAALSSPPLAQQALNSVVAALTTPGGGLAVGQAQLLADFDIGFVLVEAPIDEQLSAQLNDVSGLRPYSTTASYAIWQLITPPARVTVVEPNGTVVPVAAGAVGVSGAPVPATGGTLMLAEPEGGWSASVNGQSLSPVPSPAGSWAEAFRLPPGGGTLSVSHSGLVRDLWLIFETLALLAVIGLALPGVRLSEDAQRAEPAVTTPPAGRAEAPPAEQRDGRVPATAGSGSRSAAISRAAAASRPAAAGRRAALAGGAAVAAARSRRSAGGSRAKAKAGRGKPAKERTARDARPDLDRAERATQGDAALARIRRDDEAGRQRTASYADDYDRRDTQPGRSGRRSLDDSQPLSAGGDRAGSRPRSSSGADDRLAGRSGRGSGPQSRAWPYQDDAPAGQAADRPSRDALGRSDADQRSRGSSGEWDQPSRRAAGRSPSGSAPPPQWSSQSAEHRIPSQPDRYELDRYDAGRDQPKRYEAERYERRDADRYSRGRYERDEPDSYQPARYERDDGYQQGRYEREPREADGYRRTRGYERPRDEPDRYQSGRQDEPERSGRLGRFGRRHRDDRSAGTTRSGARQSDGAGHGDPLAGPGWPSAGGDSLEPLPENTGRSQGGSHRAGAWRPDARNSRPGWDDYAEPGHPYDQPRDWDGDDRGGRRRRSSADADYEGETW